MAINGAGIRMNSRAGSRRSVGCGFCKDHSVPWLDANTR